MQVWLVDLYGWVTCLGWALGAVLVYIGLLSDRRKGRLRCSKCWFDLAGRGESNSPESFEPFACSECGHTLKRYRSMKKRRRRWFVACVGVALIATGIQAPKGLRDGWPAAVPMPVLAIWPEPLAESFLDETIRRRGQLRNPTSQMPHWVLNEIERRRFAKTLTPFDRQCWKWRLHFELSRMERLGLSQADAALHHALTTTTIATSFDTLTLQKVRDAAGVDVRSDLEEQPSDNWGVSSAKTVLRADDALKAIALHRIHDPGRGREATLVYTNGTAVLTARSQPIDPVESPRVLIYDMTPIIDALCDRYPRELRQDHSELFDQSVVRANGALGQLVAHQVTISEAIFRSGTAVMWDDLLIARGNARAIAVMEDRLDELLTSIESPMASQPRRRIDALSATLVRTRATPVTLPEQPTVNDGLRALTQHAPMPVAVNARSINTHFEEGTMLLPMNGGETTVGTVLDAIDDLWSEHVPKRGNYNKRGWEIIAGVIAIRRFHSRDALSCFYDLGTLGGPEEFSTVEFEDFSNGVARMVWVPTNPLNDLPVHAVCELGEPTPRPGTDHGDGHLSVQAKGALLATSVRTALSRHGVLTRLERINNRDFSHEKRIAADLRADPDNDTKTLVIYDATRFAHLESEDASPTTNTTSGRTISPLAIAVAELMSKEFDERIMTQYMMINHNCISAFGHGLYVYAPPRMHAFLARHERPAPSAGSG